MKSSIVNEAMLTTYTLSRVSRIRFLTSPQSRIRHRYFSIASAASRASIPVESQSNVSFPSASPLSQPQSAPTSILDDTAISSISQFSALDSIPSPVSLIRSFILWCHEAPFLAYLPDVLSATATAPLPLWQSIVLATVALRLAITVPLAVLQQRRLARQQALQPIAEAWKATLRHQVAQVARKEGWSPDVMEKETQKRYRERVRSLYASHQYHPLRTLLLPWVQVPLWVSVSFALRGMVGYVPESAWWSALVGGAPVPGMEEGGTLWFENLTRADETLFFPLAVGWTNLANAQLGALSSAPPTPLRTVMIWSFRGLALGSMYFASQMPTAISLYWLSSALFSLGQNVVMRVWKWRKGT
ncbi:hypothetical protein M427DRAFT_300791 [Gonapodya prolifera JEL478]|uniref:Membrane insertase YidC/Oxa/ALB C-terminal domain-containing protein n=1 Tax=Gonapodya prolifera (strain JEL478) TaxID=1344416 RepID=A0A139AH63_GONPJ|nr:hypothetical protein M427DRAFT_300791 [Gonapodya prolifera JEL478]|eukprot:KXS16100.1 hypothetical protein M427DRAFT_300791 [Gonapodya prolifera JEL478]